MSNLEAAKCCWLTGIAWPISIWCYTAHVLRTKSPIKNFDEIYDPWQLCYVGPA